MIIEALMYMMKVKVSIYSAFHFISHLYRLLDMYIYRFYDIDGTIFLFILVSMNFFLCFSPFCILPMKDEGKN